MPAGFLVEPVKFSVQEAISWVQEMIWWVQEMVSGVQEMKFPAQLITLRVQPKKFRAENLNGWTEDFGYPTDFSKNWVPMAEHWNQYPAGWTKFFVS